MPRVKKSQDIGEGHNLRARADETFIAAFEAYVNACKSAGQETDKSKIIRTAIREYMRNHPIETDPLPENRERMIVEEDAPPYRALPQKKKN